MSGARHTALHARETVGAPKPRFSDDVVRRARLLNQRGYSASDVRNHLLDENLDVPLGAIEGWLRGTSRRFAGFPTK